MYPFGSTRPNFTAQLDGLGFVSICRTGEQRCTAYWIVNTMKQLVSEGKASELLEMRGGLSAHFAEGGRSSDFLNPELLGNMAWKLGTYDVPVALSVSQAYELAELAVALLNYDVNHADDDMPILCMALERKVVIDMIELVHNKATPSTLVDDLLQPGSFKLASKRVASSAWNSRP